MDRSRPEPEIRYLSPVGDISRLIEMGRALQAIATEHGIHNVFDDNGYKELLLLTLFGLKKLRREGDDAIDAQERRYEMKTVARISSDGARKTNLNVTTEHTMTLANIERYRRGFLWIVAVFDGPTPEVVYEIAPAALEPFFAKWEAILTGGKDVPARDHINNPKIPLRFIEASGLRVWPPRPEDEPRQLPPAEVQKLVEEGIEAADERDGA